MSLIRGGVFRTLRTLLSPESSGRVVYRTEERAEADEEEFDSMTAE